MPAYIAFKSFVKTQKETEYFLAKKRNKLAFIKKKWKFDVLISFSYENQNIFTNSITIYILIC